MAFSQKKPLTDNQELAVTQFFKQHHAEDVEQDLHYLLQTAIEHGRRKPTLVAATSMQHLIQLLHRLQPKSH